MQNPLTTVIGIAKILIIFVFLIAYLLKMLDLGAALAGAVAFEGLLGGLGLIASQDATSK